MVGMTIRVSTLTGRLSSAKLQRMLRPIVGGCGLGVVLFFFAAGIAAACGGASQADCHLRALSALPANPDALHACQAAPDGGAQ